MAELNQSTDFSLKSVIIAPLGTDSREGYDIKQMVGTFQYIESVTSPFIAATMNVVDSAGLLNDLPIQGGETVIVEVETTVGTEEYQLIVWKIYNRIAQSNTQAYTLGLISVEALNNEYNRVSKALKGGPDKITSELLKGLGSSKKLYSEPCKFEVKYISPNLRPFDIIAKLAMKSVPKTASAPKSNTANSKNSSESVTGTAGYFFWENKRGYNFFSVDTLLSGDTENLQSEEHGPYIERPANDDSGNDVRANILQVTFKSEVDVLASMRKGKYSSLMVFFNHSTGQYHEYHYSLDETYKSMKHLGSQNTPSIIPAGDNKISDYPTKIITSVLDHESWYNEAGPASFEEKDGASSPSPFCDFHKHFAAQSAMRYELLKNQLATVVIAGNSEICAGDRIDLKLVNKRPNQDIDNQPYDQESSGMYLIGEVTHTYDSTKGTNGKYTTTLRLMRDSYGDIESNRGN